jgi:hypothetical protein
MGSFEHGSTGRAAVYSLNGILESIIVNLKIKKKSLSTLSCLNPSSNFPIFQKKTV